jgi:hypothetical protein
LSFGGQDGGPYFVPIYDIRTSQGRQDGGQDAAAISKKLFDNVLFRVKIGKRSF